MKYIVKGNHFGNAAPMWVCCEPTGEHVIAPRRQQATAFEKLSEAVSAWCDADALCDAPRIYQVANDGTETPLPTYAEMLQSRANAKESIARLREVLESGEYTFNSKIESALMDVEESLK